MVPHKIWEELFSALTDILLKARHFAKLCKIRVLNFILFKMPKEFKVTKDVLLQVDFSQMIKGDDSKQRELALKYC